MSDSQNRPQQGGRQQSGLQQGGRPAMQGQRTETKEYALFGIAVYGAFALARFFARFLEGVLASDDSAFYNASNDVLWAASTSAFGGGDSLLIALGIGAFYYFRTSGFGAPYQPAAIAAGAGSALVSVVFLVLALVFAPDAFDLSLGDELLGLIASVISVVAAAAIVTLALEKVQTPT